MLSAEDFARLNPNTGTTPIFKTRRDAALTTAIYGRLPVLVDRSSGREKKAWPVRNLSMFHMTNDSNLFRTKQELEEKEGAYPVGGNRFRSPAGDWVPLYEGKMIWHFDHRAASVVVNPLNQYRPGYPRATEPDQHLDPNFVPTPQFWVLATDKVRYDKYVLAYRDVTNPTDRRTLDACFIPYYYAGNTLILISDEANDVANFALLCANLNSIVLDYTSRQKVQKNHLSLYIVEQLPIVQPYSYNALRFGRKSAGEVVREAVLELTYTAHDMAPFARDMGFVDANRKVRPPFQWNDDRRLMLCAKLDAIYFRLYGVTNRDDVRYIYSTFDIVEREQNEAHRRYLSCDLCLAWMSALAAGNPDADIKL